MRWLAGAGQGKALFDEGKESGILLKKGYTPSEARQLRNLLFAPPVKARDNARTFEALALGVESRRVAIAELSHVQLVYLASGTTLPPFNAAGPLTERRKFAEAVKDMITRKQLPPRRASEERPANKAKANPRPEGER
jgi:hypothetical protein